MFRSSMRSSSGRSLFTSFPILLILKIIKILKNIIFHRGYVAAYVWYACNAYSVEA